MKNIKRRLGLIISATDKIPILRRILIEINHILFHFMEREYTTNRKSDSDTIYYVIRPQSENVGLLASYFFVLRKTKEALENGLIPIVDFQNYKCQYSVNKPINGSFNAWEYYFEQPGKCGLDVLSPDSKIIYSGWRLFKEEEALVLDETIISNYTLRDLAVNKLNINRDVEARFHEKYTKLFENKKTLGVFVRGTDYVALRPKGHNVQPSIDMVIEKINEYLKMYEIDQIFIVTEDYNYFCKIKNEIDCMVITSDNSFVRNYNPNNYVSESIEEDGYTRGRDYLIRLLLLTKCQYIISSYASGSVYSKLIRDKEPEAEFWFDLGKY